MNTIDTKKIAQELVAYFGGSQTATGKALNVSQPTVKGWLSGKHGISAAVAIRASIATSGKFSPELISADLRDLPGSAA